MKLAMRLPSKKGEDKSSGSEENASTISDATDTDPRDGESAEIIDLASRTAYIQVAQGSSKSDGLGLAAGVVFVLALGGVTWWSMNAARVAEPESIGRQTIAPGPTTPVVATTQPVKEPAKAGANPRRADPAPAPVLARAPIRNPASLANPYASPTIVFDAGARAASSARGAQTTVPSASALARVPSNSGVVAGSAAAFANRIGGVGGAAAQAEPMANPSTTVTQGTLIPAVLETAIDTDVPGFVRAVVSQDVRSFDGTNVLVPRSSRLIGQYQSGVQGGQKRAYVIWTRLIRPDGASVNIASPGVGFDGTTGLEGDVNSHFFKRFGSAMLLSVVGSLGALTTGGSSVVLGGAGSSAASVAAQQDGQIGPTIRVRQGQPIRVFTARDLGFEGV